MSEDNQAPGMSGVDKNTTYERKDNHQSRTQSFAEALDTALNGLADMDERSKTLPLPDKATEKHKFANAIAKQNVIIGSAIQSLDNLNEQVVQYSEPESSLNANLEFGLSDDQKDNLKSSLALMRHLLLDAQRKFRNMVDENKRLASKIDGTLQVANHEVLSLRTELADTNKRLLEISQDGSMESGHTNDDDNIQMQEKEEREEEIKGLREKNEKLEQVVRGLQREVVELRRIKTTYCDSNSANEIKFDYIQSQQELSRAKESITAMKLDRKRLKSEKVDLLSQMKQLYCTLEDKESELRDFIRNYEMRMKESDDTIKQLAFEKEESEREKWEILARGREAAERSVKVRNQLFEAEGRVKALEEELQQLQQERARLTSTTLGDDTTSGSNLTSIHSNNNTIETPESLDTNGATGFFTTSTPVEMRHPRVPEAAASEEDLKRLEELHTIKVPENVKFKKKKSSGFRSFSQVFTKGRNRRSLAMDPKLLEYDKDSPGGLKVLNTSNYREKQEIVRQCKDVSMSHWKANQVLAWLEITMCMPSYGKKCIENVKSGKVLLGLSDSELESALGINSYLHRRKLRLAIEEYRDPTSSKFPKASTIDHTWVSLKWLHDIGLPQYSTVFETLLIDGRVLNTLQKKHIEKHLNVHRKFHQSSLLHGVELLRRLNFDKEALLARRKACENSDFDPIVWSNQRVVKWINSIDLQEYADNLLESGVHGAMLVLEPSLTADTLATALSIPPSKSYVRRHLMSEWNNVIHPA
ncbi:unnamed protein product, partial [Owenia fusiformis]